MIIMKINQSQRALFVVTESMHVVLSFFIIILLIYFSLGLISYLQADLSMG